MRVFEGFQNGVNLGGWISQFSEYSIEHFDTYIVESDIKAIADNGFDHVRVPVDYIVLEDEDGNVRESGYEYLDKCRVWCEKYGLHMLIDLHECHGYSFDPMKKDDKKQFFYNEEHMTRFLSLWENIAKRFGKYDFIAFEPLNEVVPFDVIDAWNALLARYIKLIRSICPTTYLVIGGVCYNSVGTVKFLDIPVDEYIVYNFHCYEPMVFTHQGAHWVDFMPVDFRIGYPKSLEEYQKASYELQKELAGAIFEPGIPEIGPDFFEYIFKPAIDKAINDGCALYCGEHGVIDKADKADRANWLSDINKAFEKYSIGHAIWNYKGMNYDIREMMKG